MTNITNNSNTSAPPVVVVGSGAAGLAAAFKLKQAGFSVRILESDYVIGGKLRTKQRDGFTIDQGAFFMPTTHQRMVALATEAGFADQIDVGGSIMAVIRDGLIHNIDINHALRDLVRTNLFSTRTKLSLGRLIGPFLDSRKGGFDKVPELAHLDTETADAWARRELGDELADYVVGMILRAMSGANAETATRLEFTTLLTLLKGAKLVACRDGMGAYAANLAKGSKIELNARVEQVVKQNDGVEITWRDSTGNERTEFAAGCIVAGSTETAVKVIPELDPWRKNYLNRTTDKLSFILNIALSQQPKNIAATYMLLPKSTHPFLTGICSDHHKAPGRVPNGKGLLSIMPTYDWGEQHFNDADDQIISNMLEALDTVIPNLANDIEFAEVARWPQRYNPIGHYRDLKQFRAVCTNTDSRIQLAGDYFGYANLESAICSGEQAALRLTSNL